MPLPYGVRQTSMVLNMHSKANHHPPNNQIRITRSTVKLVTSLYGLYSKDLGKHNAESPCVNVRCDVLHSARTVWNTTDVTSYGSVL